MARTTLQPLIAPDQAHRSSSRMFWQVALAALALRIVAAPWVAHTGDIGAFIGWGERLANIGPAHFWTGGWWCDYLPGYLLVLWVCGEISVLLRGIAPGLPTAVVWLLFKLPNLAADVATAWIIWRSTREKLGRGGLWLPMAYLFNPAVLLNATFWGQADSFHALGLVGGLYLLVRGRAIWAGIVLGYALAIKPHSLVVLPMAGAFAIRQGLNWWRIVVGAVLVPAVFAATFLPFNGWSIGGLLGFIQSRFDATMGEYGHATINALNLWYLTGHNWAGDDAQIIFGLTIRHIAYFLCITGLLAIVGRYWRQRRDATSGVWEAAGLSYLVVFLFVTRAHERHVFPYFALLAIAVAWRRAALVPWVLLSATYCVNLALAWRYALPGHQSAQLCPPVIGAFLCLLNIAILPLTVLACQRRGQRWFDFVRRIPPAPAAPLAESTWAQRHGRIALAVVVGFALVTRVARLNEPPKRYFDEVYHAYTAEQWVKGNTDAWLWGEKAPDPGCSYEWTHPPLAKLIMAASMHVFGIHPWAWRLPGALFGTVSVVLIYGIALTLFKHRGVALLAAAFAALDVLPLFSSRIAMNDVYCVTFILLAVLLALRRGWVVWAAPLAVGLAIACKWTALYALPLLGFIHIVRTMPMVRGQGHRPSWWAMPMLPSSWAVPALPALIAMATMYVVIVPLVYLASYGPFFRAEHTWPQFVELQKQMWFYHTGLTASHAHSSPAWQWPLLSKAVWCHTDRIEVANKAPPPAQPSANAVARATPATHVDVTTNAGSTQSDAPAAPAASAWVANIYAWGNPVIWCAGLGALLFAGYHVVVRRDPPVVILLAGYLAFWAPWLMSPRIMFLYHYLPSLPFLYIGLAWAITRTGMSRRTIVALLCAAGVAFALIYPYVTAVYLPEALRPGGWRWR